MQNMETYIFNNETGISDKETFDAVRKSTNKGRIIPSISKIRLCMFRPIEYLDLTVKGLEIENLEFLQFFPDLTELYIRSGRLRDLTPLKYIPKLEKFYLMDADIDSLKPLLNFNRLDFLNLENVNVRDGDFSIMGKLKTVRHMNAYNCGITNIEWIIAMESLETAGFDGNLIDNYSFLKGTQKLKMVSYDGDYYEAPFDDLL